MPASTEQGLDEAFAPLGRLGAAGLVVPAEPFFSRNEPRKHGTKRTHSIATGRRARLSLKEIVEVIRPIYKRGKKSMADHVRSYIHAAFSWGLKSENSTRRRRFLCAAVTLPVATFPCKIENQISTWFSQEPRVGG
jgi:hypothetical protein